MAYQPSWVIWCQIHPWRRTVVGAIKPIAGIKMDYPFLKSISLKMDIIARLDFEFTSNDVAVLYVSHCATAIPSCYRHIQLSMRKHTHVHASMSLCSHTPGRIRLVKKLMRPFFLFVCLFICFFLWYINLCSLFIANSIFIQINTSISNYSV